MILVELQRAENGFVMVACPEIEKKKVNWYIAADSEQVGQICKDLADNYEKYGGEKEG